MAIVKFGDIVRDVKINVDRANNPYEHYVAGDHMDSEDLTIHRYGSFETDDVGPAFTRIFKPGQILYGSRRTYLKKVAVADFEGICANTTFVLESKDEALFDNRLLPFIMLSDAFTRWSIAHSKGSTNPYVLFSDLADYEFDLPPLAEQKVLADKLWAAYRLKESYKKLLVATEEMVKSQFIEMFGCLAERVALSSLCDTFIDGDWIEAKDQSGSGIRLIQTGNVGVGTFKDKGDRARYISEETFNRLNCTEVVEGDILISRLPEPVGRACIIPAGLGKSITAVDCTIIRLNDKVLPKFFVAFTNTPDYAMQIKKVLSGTTRLRVSRANLGKIQVPLPSIDKQQQFVTIAEQADKSGFDGRKSQFIEMFKDKEPNGNIADLVYTSINSVKKSFNKEDSIEYIDISSVNAKSHTLSNTTQYIVNSAPSRAQQCVQIGDILVSTVRPINRNIAVVDCDLKNLVASTGFCVLRPKEGYREYLLSIVTSDKYTDKMCDIASGGLYPAVNNGDVLSYEIFIPDEDFLCRITRIYRQADKSGSGGRESVALMDKVKKSLINYYNI